MASLDPSQTHMILFAIIGGLLPAFFWLWFWLKEDKAHPEPRGLILRALLAGAVSVVASFYIERLFTSDFELIRNYTPSWKLSEIPVGMLLVEMPILFGWAVIEEVMKFLGAELVIFRHRDYDEPIDAMIYMITVAIGFAATENILFLVNSVLSNEGGIYFLLTGNLRFLGATVLHTVSSAIVGGMMALSFYGSRWKKIIYVLGGLISATVLHAYFNFFIIANNGQEVFKVLTVLWLDAIFVIYLFERVKHVTCLNIKT